MATAPNCGALIVENAPLKLPMGVRTALTMHTSVSFKLLEEVSLLIKCPVRMRTRDAIFDNLQRRPGKLHTGKKNEKEGGVRRS